MQRIDRPFTLRQQFEHLETMRMDRAFPSLANWPLLQIPPMYLDQVEVVNGVASALYGARNGRHHQSLVAAELHPLYKRAAD